MLRYKLVALVCSLLVSVSVYANPPKPNVYDGGNRWLITAYNDASSVHTQWATQGICFLPFAIVGTQIRGAWYSDTFPDWNGRYAQEGDQLFMHGDYARNVGHDGMEIQLFTMSYRDTAAGHWKEWREDISFGRTIGFANATMVRVGKCPIITEAELDKLNIPPRYLTSGEIAENPNDPDQVPLESTQLPQ